MKRLINTKLFSLLKKIDGTFNPSEQDTRSVYDDFVHKVTLLCTLAGGGVPAYFTMHYTRLELEGLHTLLGDGEAGEKCTNPKLY